MNKLLYTASFLLVGLLVVAQADPNRTDSYKTKTLFKNPNHVGWYAGADFEYTKFSGKNAYLGGISGGVIFDKVFSMGLAFLVILNSPHLNYGDIVPNRDVFLYGSYGGLKFEYMLYPSKVVFVKFPVLVGGGGVTYETTNSGFGNSNNSSYAKDDFFVVEPGVLVGFNLIKYIRFEIGGSYRLTTNVYLPNTDPNILNGFNAVTSLKFGVF